MSCVENAPVYDDRVKRILSYLEKGLSRKEVAEKFKYNSYRSMDMFMARRNFKMFFSLLKSRTIWSNVFVIWTDLVTNTPGSVKRGICPDATDAPIIPCKAS